MMLAMILRILLGLLIILMLLGSGPINWLEAALVA